MGTQSINTQEQLFASMGTDLSSKQEITLDEKWLCWSLNHNSSTQEIPIILIQNGPKNIAEIKKRVKNFDTCIVLFAERNTLFLKSPNESHTVVLENESDYQKISVILKACGIADANDEFSKMKAIQKAIVNIPDATGDFINKGLFATHYLKTRIFNDVRHDVESDIPAINQIIGERPDKILKILGWNMTVTDRTYHNGKVSITVTEQNDFSIREHDAITPSYSAIAKLKDSQWSLLTNGKKWRLYSNRISASSTNYFEITLDPARNSITKYLTTIFASKSFESIDGKADIDVFFDEGRNYATELEENLSDKILDKDGLFLNIIKSILDHDIKKTFSLDDLNAAKHTALKIMYRVWFVAYAESRNLLPVNDSKYKPISLQSLRSHLDSYEENPEDLQCWEDLKRLFEGIRKGSTKHNLPQYDGNLFRYETTIDGIDVRNIHIVSALRDLLEQDGDAIDYANLSVRHLGNIFEALMEFSVRQTDKDIILLADKKGLREVKTTQKFTYSYKKNELYLASKGGIASRKTTASFYTPDEIVKFLVSSGLDPIFEEREPLLKEDLKRYRTDKSDKNKQACMNRLLDIQVLDPSMGSGHFLVEALNRITQWVTNMLDAYPDHPLLEDIEQDRKTVIQEQNKKGITLEEDLLTHDVLLKRKIMKRCIFGVDINSLAVDLAKLSLWLDSFAIGVPLTYMDHHIKTGDSTIGMFLDDLKKKEMHTLDDWSSGVESNKMICDVITNSDITVEQVRDSEEKYREHQRLLEPTKRILDALTASKIRPDILPKKAKEEFIHRFGRYSKNESDDLVQARRVVNELAERHTFFHWELEMMDAFTDNRRGFDCVVGNFPWEKIKPNNDEFFTPYDPVFRSLTPNTEKEKRIETLCKDPKIKKAYELYKKKYEEKSAFYSTYEMQGVGDKDLWKLVLERTFKLVAQNGIISMIIPSQILSSVGAAKIRKHILERDILSLHVFENRKKIFEIDSRYRFALFCVRNNMDGPDEFPAGFYLHNLESLYDNDKEKDKFGTLSKQMVCDSSPDDYVMPESVGPELAILGKLFQNDAVKSGLDVWNIALSRGFDKTNDADLLLESGKGWPVFEGGNIHQYDHRWSTPDFTANNRTGLKRESSKRIFAGRHREIHDSFRMAFRDIARSTDMRTTIATIIPPHAFHTCSLRSIVFTHAGEIRTDVEYDKKITYLCGIFNSMTFDFVARARIQMGLATIIKSLPLPKHPHEEKITQLAAKLVVGTPEFEGLAESLRIPNILLTPAQCIETTAELDVLVAHSYDLTPNEYETIIDSFNLFTENHELYDIDEITWNNTNLKEFYGETAKLALEYFKTISGEST